MHLRPTTKKILSEVRSYRQLKGFQSAEDIRTFWRRYGATGFLNIKEITPAMVREIRINIIEKPKAGV